MLFFEFSNLIIEKVLEELANANEYIKIAVFQIHHEDIFKLLLIKLKQGVKVEIITLPYDSIHSDAIEKYISLYEELISNGAKLYFCEWNVEDPERTTTAIGRWYSFHGKFIVTDKVAISLSANLINKNELDCILISTDSESLDVFNRKFKNLFDLFIKETNTYSGTLRQTIEAIESVAMVDILFKLPNIIETQTHERHWIRQYPSNLCPQNIVLKDGLFIIPFDVRGRNLYMDIINDAKEYICLSTESFTDSDFAQFLVKTSLKSININININILTGATSMDFADRMQSMLRDLLANNIRIKSIKEGIHGKLLITENYLVVGSINLNKMNLGFPQTSKYWRGNTETITICTDKDTIAEAKRQFYSIFSNAIEIEDYLADKILSKVGDVFFHNFGIRSDSEAKKIFAIFILKQEIQVKRLVIVIAKISARIIKELKRKKVEKDILLMSIILYYLSERKLSLNELTSRITSLNISFDIPTLLDILIKNNLIELDGDYYKIKIA